MLTYLGLLLTFGAMFPPLAAAIVVTIFAWTAFARLKVGRFVYHAMTQHQPQYVNIIEMECQGVGSVTVLQNAMWMLITVSCLFYTLFLFDTLGDAVGFDGAYWVLIVVPLMPLFLYLCFKLYSTRVTAQHKLVDRKSHVFHTGDLELQPVDETQNVACVNPLFSRPLPKVEDAVPVNSTTRESEVQEEGECGDTQSSESPQDLENQHVEAAEALVCESNEKVDNVAESVLDGETGADETYSTLH